MAGDIGNPYGSIYRDYIYKCSTEYEHTFIIPGNHEYWGNNIDETNYKMDQIINRFDNVYSLRNKIVVADNVNFIGCTLWSHLKEDSKQIQNISLNNRYLDRNGLNKLHFSDVKWLFNRLNSTNIDTVVVTHHLPTFKLIHGKFKKDKYKEYYDRFYTDLEYLIKPPVKVWIGGHSHCTMRISLNGVDLRINSYGYPNQFEKYYLKHKVKRVDLVD